MLGVAALEADAIREAGAADVVLAEVDHVLGGIDGDDLHARCAAAEDNGDLRGAGADIEHRCAAGPEQQEVVDERLVDLAMVHRVVIARLGGGVHHFGLEHTRQHDAPLALARGGTCTPSRYRPAGGTYWAYPAGSKTRLRAWAQKFCRA